MTATSSPSSPPDDLGALCRDNHVALTHTGTGALDGLTFAAKDVFHIEGTRTGFGNPDWLASHPPADRTAASVEALLGAGADMVGRAVSDEITYSLTGENAHYGTPLNPAAPDRIPGGSSSGSASAVAGGIVDCSLGTDCGGSVRIPASYCGIFGMRPTHGAVPLDGVIPFAPSFDTVGWFARDAAVLDEIGRVLLEGPRTTPPFERVLVAVDAFDLVEPNVARALEEPTAAIAGAVGRSEDLVVSPEGLPGWADVFKTIQGFEIWSNHGPWIESERPKIGPGVRERLKWASTVRAADAEAARRRRREIRERLEALLGPGDVLCLPTSPRPAPRKDETIDRIEVAFREQAMALLCIAGLGGLPQVSLPIAQLRGLPLGISVVGAWGSDRRLLEFARSLRGPELRG